MIKLIASDLDGTLLKDYDGKIPAALFPAIRELKEKGVMFVAASGRQYKNQQKLFKPVNDDIAYICENGSLLIYKEEILFKSYIERDLGIKITKEALKRENCEVVVSGIYNSYIQPKEKAFADYLIDVIGNQTVIVEDISEIKEDFLKVSVYDKEDGEASIEYFSERYGNEVTVVTSGNGWVDMVQKNINKAKAIEELLFRFNIKPEEVMAFGDQQNDIEMLQLAGASYAVADARKEVKEAARYVTDDVVRTVQELI